MAALSDRPSEPVVDLRRLGADHLAPIFEEEIAVWRDELDWDFRPSADLVRRFVRTQSLSGFALIRSTARGPRAIGYAYYVCEEHKGLIGDLCVLREYRTIEDENALLDAVLSALWHTPGVRRIEAQLMMISSPLQRAIPRESSFHTYPRKFFETSLDNIVKLPRKNPPGIAISRWAESLQDDTARLIASAYHDHIDSQINDQYRSPSGSRRFLTNIVQYPGCGAFFAPGSYAAADLTGHLRGVSLASLVAPEVGHITQVCVAPEDRGKGLGYELIRQSLIALAAHGCRIASLTVTASNEPAIGLYRRMGFINRRDFAAYVWEPR